MPILGIGKDVHQEGQHQGHQRDSYVDVDKGLMALLEVIILQEDALSNFEIFLHLL